MVQNNVEKQDISEEYNNINDRLKEIKEQVSDESLSLDESLKLYEEAVVLGMQATKTVEQNVYANLHSQNENGPSEDASASKADSDELPSSGNKL